jgi:hypothetical protein
MLLLFCSEPFAPRTVDPAFADEWDAAKAAGLSAQLIDFERLVAGELDRALAQVPPDASSTIIYRGWMLAPDAYKRLYAALSQRGATTINDPHAYRTCHYLPESYSLLEGKTPQSVWLPITGEVDFDRVMTNLAELGPGPVVVKDYAKSQKHYWAEACYIPNARDRTSVERVVTRFLELQGNDLAEGLVFRCFVRLRQTGVHPKSGMPLSEEYRIFWLDHEPLVVTPYWDVDAAASEVPIDELRTIALRIPSRFFSMDVAVREDGSWLVIELGDAQVSGLQACAPALFYEALAERWSRTD